MKKWNKNVKYLSNKRFSKNYKHALKSKKREVKPDYHYVSKPISLMHQACDLHWSGSNTIGVQVDKNFSIIENPSVVVDTFLQFSEVTRSRRIRQIEFNYSGVENLDNE